MPDTTLLIVVQVKRIQGHVLHDVHEPRALQGVKEALHRSTRSTRLPPCECTSDQKPLSQTQRTATGRKMMCEEAVAPNRKHSELRDPRRKRVCETDFCAKAESAFLPIRDELGYRALCEDSALQRCMG
jgi:hypothetical protein